MPYSRTRLTRLCRGALLVAALAPLTAAESESGTASEAAAAAPAAEAAPAVASFTDWKNYRDAIRDAEREDDWERVVALIDANGLDPAEDSGDRAQLYEYWCDALARSRQFDRAVQVLDQFVQEIAEKTRDQESCAREIFQQAERVGDLTTMQAAIDRYRQLSDDVDRIADMRIDLATMPQGLDELVTSLRGKDELDAADARTLAEICEEDDWPQYDPATALSAWQRLLALQPDNNRAHYGVLRNLLRDDQLDAALTFYQGQTAGMSVDDADGLVKELGRDLVRADRQAEAVTLIETLASRLEALPAARLRGDLLEDVRLRDQAATAYQEALQLARGETAPAVAAAQAEGDGEAGAVDAATETAAADSGTEAAAADASVDIDLLSDLTDDLVDVLRREDRYADAIAAIDALLPSLEAESARQLRWRYRKAELQERLAKE